MTSRSLAALALAGLAAAALLAGCGRQGELERPAPLFGKASQPSPDALRRQQAAQRAYAEGQARADPQAPQSVDEVRSLGLWKRDQAHATDAANSQNDSVSDSPPAPPP